MAHTKMSPLSGHPCWTPFRIQKRSEVPEEFPLSAECPRYKPFKNNKNTSGNCIAFTTVWIQLWAKDRKTFLKSQKAKVGLSARWTATPNSRPAASKSMGFCESSLPETKPRCSPQDFSVASRRNLKFQHPHNTLLSEFFNQMGLVSPRERCTASTSPSSLPLGM